MKIISTVLATLMATAVFASVPPSPNFPAPCFPKPCTWAPPGPWPTEIPVTKDKKDKKDTTPVTSKAESTITK